MKTTRPTWQQLIEVEPRLVALKERAQSTKAKSKNYCQQVEFDNQFRSEIDDLVLQPTKKHKLLGNWEAVDVTTRAIRQVLPPCKHKDMLCPGK